MGASAIAAASVATIALEHLTGGVAVCRWSSAALLAGRLVCCLRAGTESGTVSGVAAACMVAAALELLTGGVAVCTTISAASPAMRLDKCLRAGTEAGTGCATGAGCSNSAALHSARLADASVVTAACMGASAAQPCSDSVGFCTSSSASSPAVRLERFLHAGVESGKACTGGAACFGSAELCLDRFAGACSGAEALAALAAARAERSRACGDDAGVLTGADSGKACGGGAACFGVVALRLERFAGACLGAEALGLSTTARAELLKTGGSSAGIWASSLAGRPRLGAESGTAAGELFPALRALVAGVAAPAASLLAAARAVSLLYADAVFDAAHVAFLAF